QDRGEGAAEPVVGVGLTGDARVIVSQVVDVGVLLVAAAASLPDEGGAEPLGPHRRMDAVPPSFVLLLRKVHHAPFTSVQCRWDSYTRRKIALARSSSIGAAVATPTSINPSDAAASAAAVSGSVRDSIARRRLSDHSAAADCSLGRLSAAR